MNISDLIGEYEQSARIRGVGETQLNALLPVRRGLGMYKPAQLTSERQRNYVAERRGGKHTRAHAKVCASNGTIRRELGALAAVFSWAEGKRLIPQGSAPELDLPAKPPGRKVYLTEPEADDMWKHAEAWTRDNVGMFVMMALDTWARTEAIETVPWNRVSLSPDRIDYRDPFRPETSKRRTVATISPRLRPVIEHRYRTRNPLSELVVGPVTYYAWRQFVQTTPYAERGLTRHDLRRTGISLAFARGVDPMKICQMSGDDLDTLLEHYAVFAPDYLSDVFLSREQLHEKRLSSSLLALPSAEASPAM